MIISKQIALVKTATTRDSQNCSRTFRYIEWIIL